MTTALPLATAAPFADVAATPPLEHDEAMVLAETEFNRMLDLLRSLHPDDWARPTACSLWTVRDMVAHVVGMADAQASFRQFAHDFRSAGKRDGGAMIDALNATQVRDRAGIAPAALIERLAAISPKAVRARRRTPAPMRNLVRFRQDPPFDAERWQYGFLVDTIFTRDTWVHRIDISRAIGRDLVVSAQHDARIVADVVADWARRHGAAFTLTLSGPAGGCWRSGADGHDLELDAIDFCWTVAGRSPGAGLLATPVPF